MNSVPPTNQLLYLSRREVEAACANIDSVATLATMFKLHASGKTILPDEAYLGWQNQHGENARNLNMPGYLGGELSAVGTKIINANPSNFQRGIARADAVTLLFDPETARILCIMEGAYISALRTASVTALSADLLAPPNVENMALIGSGALAAAHLELLSARLKDLRHIYLYDTSIERATPFKERFEPLLRSRDITLTIAPSAREAIEPSQLIVPVTTTTTGYIPLAWLQPGALLVNISLDDALPDVVLQAHKVIVDDWNLVKTDPRRLIGRMYREGLVDFAAPGDDAPPSTTKRLIDAELGEVVLGTKPGRSDAREIILVNPFGMAIEDIALAKLVYQEALQQKLGLLLER